jgi:anti-sigma B factor antagonist
MGEIDVENAYMIKDAVQEVLAGGRPRRIELNMRGVTFIAGVRLVVTQPSRFAHRQLWVTGLLGLFGNPDPLPDSTGPAEQPAVSGT